MFFETRHYDSIILQFFITLIHNSIYYQLLINFQIYYLKDQVYLFKGKALIIIFALLIQLFSIFSLFKVN